jgi:transcriptional regulator MraZ
MFLGEYRHTVDIKGRVFIPARFRVVENQRFFVNLGLDGGLSVFTEEGWSVYQERINELDMMKKDARAFKRIAFANATEGICDKQGRINLPDHLIRKANLDKEVMIVGVSDHFEIWDIERWDLYQREVSERYEELAENLAQ